MTLPSSPMASDNFVRHSTSRNAHWAFYLLTILCVILAYIGGQLPLEYAVQNAIYSLKVEEQQVDAFYATLDFTLLGIDLKRGLLLLLAGHLFAGLALLTCNSLIHRRPTRWLFTGTQQFRWGKVIWSFVLWILLLAGVELVLYALRPETYSYSFDWSQWLPLLPVILLLIPLQTTVEELIFRGYLLPWLSAISKKPWFGILSTSILFAAMHMGNPEVTEFGRGVMLTYYMLVGIFLGALTIADNGTELAIGVHAATNVYGAAFVGFEGSVLQFGAPIQISEVDPWAMTAGFAVMIVAFSLLAQGKYQINLVSSLFIRTGEKPIQEN